MADSHIRRGSRPGPADGQAAGDPPGHGNRAFAIWLERGLHQLYDGVASEPIPDELLKLIEGDRNHGKRE